MYEGDLLIETRSMENRSVNYAEDCAENWCTGVIKSASPYNSAFINLNNEVERQRQSKKTRFDLEQEIMHCWNIVDDIKLIYTTHLDKRELTDDELANILIGLQELYQLKFETLFETFEECLRKNEFKPYEPRKAVFHDTILDKVSNEQSTTRKNEVRYNEGDYELGN